MISFLAGLAVGGLLVIVYALAWLRHDRRHHHSAEDYVHVARSSLHRRRG